jgi:hypothetical protein
MIGGFAKKSSSVMAAFECNHGKRTLDLLSEPGTPRTDLFRGGEGRVISAILLK